MIAWLLTQHTSHHLLHNPLFYQDPVVWETAVSLGQTTCVYELHSIDVHYQIQAVKPFLVPIAHCILQALT